ncbi:MAG: hypothetical protein OXN97_19055, partial [Bryobacterales bacterium]|nr:hypothetical protein [Bryobacterales bacterium]
GDKMSIYSDWALRSVIPFRKHHVAMHELLGKLEVPHVYRDGPQRTHHWQSGWLAEAVELLTDECGAGETKATRR